MSLIITLLVATFVLVAFEVILPGGILGVIAVICLIAATIITFMDYGIWAAAATFAGSGVGLIILVVIEFKLLANTSVGNAFFLKETITGRSSPEIKESLVGKAGMALTRLNPSGKVQVEGKTYEANSQDGYIDAEQTVTVVAQNNSKLMIRKL